MHLFAVHPILVGSVLLGACLLALAIHLANIPPRAFRIRISRSADPDWNGNYGRGRPPLTRSFLRGRCFAWSREAARGHLYILAARATRGNDEEAARFLERAGLALRAGGAVVSGGALASVAGTGFDPELVARAPAEGASGSGAARDLRSPGVEMTRDFSNIYGLWRVGDEPAADLLRRADVAELRRRELADGSIVACVVALEDERDKLHRALGRIRSIARQLADDHRPNTFSHNAAQAILAEVETARREE